MKNYNVLKILQMVFHALSWSISEGKPVDHKDVAESCKYFKQRVSEIKC